jgi:anthranilate phosphoribosyltransferase
VIVGGYLKLPELEDRLKEFDINRVLKYHAFQNQPLDFDTAYLLGVFTLIPHVPELQGLLNKPLERISRQSIAALCALHNKATYQQENSGEQIAGICAAVFDYDIGISEYGFVKIPTGMTVMDNCGMGGDLYRTPNLSTIAALIAASEGITMLKHGSPGNTDSVGSSDFLRYCGVNLFPEKLVMEEALLESHFGYTDALDTRYKRIHTQTHELAKLAHMNDIIGPITNPADPGSMLRRVIGVNHLIPPIRLAQAYQILNGRGVTHVERALFVRGFSTSERNGGIDEVSIMPGGTMVAELNLGEITEYHLYARDFGLEEAEFTQLDPGSNKAEMSRMILAREVKDARRDAALANASILFYLQGNLTFLQGTERARLVLESGRPYEILQKYAKLSQGGKT